MRGHEGVIAMRMAGKKPQIVFVNDYPCQTDWADWGEHATVCTAGDSLTNMELRFVIGLTVSISALLHSRAARLAQLCKDNGATVVAYSSKDGDPAIWAKE